MGLTKLNKCCCCIDLPLGCKIIAILGFIADACFFAAIGGAGYSQYVLIPGNVIGMLGCICLLYGAFTSHKTAVALYLIADATKTVLYFGFGIMIFVIGGQQNDSTNILIGAGYGIYIAIGVMIFLFACTWMYFWLVVFSFFKKIGGKVDKPRV